MGEWIRGISIVGGRLFGETAPCADGFRGYSVGDNDTIGWNGSGDDPKSEDLNEFFLDVPVNTGVNERATIAVLQGTDEYPLNKIVIEMQLRSEQAWGRARLSLNQYVGYYNDSQQFIEVFGCSNGNYSAEGVSSYADLSLRLHLCVYEQNGRKVLGVANSIKSASRDSYAIAGNLSSVAFIQSYLPGGSDLPVSSPEFGKPAKKKGGYNPDHHRKGTFDDSSDKITPSSAPTLSPLTTGFIHMYKVSDALLAHISDALFYRPIRGIDLIESVNELVEAFWNNKRIDYILDLMILPLNIPSGTLKAIIAGGSPLQWVNDDQLVVDVQGYEITNPYIDFSCGRIVIPEYWANFLDFSGTRIKLFLPYVGYVDIQPEYINGGELKVDYRFNIVDGSFMCFVRSTSGHSELDESLIGQYAGVAVMHVPLQSQDYSNKISGLISSMGAIAAAGMSGGASMGFGAASSLANTAIQKPSSTSSNGYNASSSFLSHRKPYLIIERQSSQFSEKYPEEKGLPLYIKANIGDCHGLTVCDAPHLDTIPATIEEKELIYKYLTEGIIV